MKSAAFQETLVGKFTVCKDLSGHEARLARLSVKNVRKLRLNHSTESVTSFLVPSSFVPAAKTMLAATSRIIRVTIAFFMRILLFGLAICSLQIYAKRFYSSSIGTRFSFCQACCLDAADDFHGDGSGIVALHCSLKILLVHLKGGQKMCWCSRMCGCECSVRRIESDSIKM